MTTQNPSTSGSPAASSNAVLDWVSVTRPRIASFVALASYVGGWLASAGEASSTRLLEAAFWVTCTAASASIFNAVIERETDGKMHRTRTRPLVTGRIAVAPATAVGALLAIVGATGLALRFEPIAALLALGTIIAYALVYTPLKRITTFNTLVGAVPGAMPPLIGYAAIAGDGGVWGWSLFAILFVWQFPHFLAIAWLYREDYARADMKMLASVPNSEGIAGRQSLLYCLPIVPVSLIPGLMHEAGPIYMSGVSAAGFAFVLAAAAFARREDERNAKRLLRSSLLYLPIVLGVAVLDAVVGV
ncbi:MAG: heme o synthase [Planctomycetota bacterium]|jgi:protoheme IX farnesyltransferase